MKIGENWQKLNEISSMGSKKEQIEELANKIFEILFANDNVVDGINACLAIIGKFFNVSRVYIFENSRDNKYCSNTFEWCNKGIKSEIDNLQNLSYKDDLGLDYCKKIQNDRLVYIPCVCELPKRPRKILEGQNIKSMLHHAIYDGDEFMGFVGFDECNEQEYSWVKEHKDVLIFFSKVISAFFIKKKKSDLLKEKRELIENFMERRTSGIFIVDKKTHKVNYLNKNLAKEVCKDKLIKAALGIFFDDKYDKEHFLITKKIVRKLNFSTFMLTYLDENRTFMVEVRNVISFGKKSNVFYFTEITKTVRLRNELEQVIKITKQSRRAKKDFIALLGNDLKKPINEIIDTAIECQNNIDDENEIKEKFLEIKAIINHLLNMVNDVLDMKRIENGAFILQNDKFNLKKEVEKILLAVSNVARRKNQMLLEDIELEHSGFKGDLKKIKRILYNVLINAVTYTKKGGNIVFKMRERKFKDSETAIIEIIVIDNGQGISENKLKEIFDFDRSRYMLKMGGLGLMLTKATLNAIGGSIEIKSKLKEGTKVKIEYSLKTLTVLECLKNNIPYKATSEERFGALNLSLKGASRLPSVSDFSKSKCLTAEEIFAKLKGLKILVAEDHNVNKLVIKRILMRANIEVLICDNGELVVNKFLKSEPEEFDLILMDIQMPVMDGYEATRKIRNSKHLQGKTIPILALSANIFLDDLEISKQAGMNDHLVKPIDANVLYEKIYQYIFLGNTEKMGVNCD